MKTVLLRTMYFVFLPFGPAAGSPESPAGLSWVVIFEDYFETHE